MSSQTWLPYVVSGLGGAVAGLLEVLRKFETREGAALRTIWGWMLILFNLSLAPTLLWVYGQASAGRPSVLAAALLGVSLPAVIRTNYTLAKGGLGEGKDLQVNFSFFSDTFMEFFKRQAESAVAAARQRLVRSVMGRFQSVEDMLQATVRAISEGGCIPVDEMQQATTLATQTAVNPATSEGYKRAYLATMILRAADAEYVRSLVKR